MAKNQVVAIDIGTKTTKVVQLEQTATSLHFVNAIVVERPKNENKQTVTTAIDEIWKSLGNPIPTGVRAIFNRSKMQVTIALPRFLVSTKRLPNLPDASDDQLENLVAMAAETELPFRVEDAIFTYHDVRRTAESTSVELISTRRATVQEYISPLEKHRISPSAIVPSMVAIAETARITSTPENSLQNRIIVDIGAELTDFCFMQGNSLRFSRSFLTGGNHLTESVMAALNVEFETAEQEKRTISAREEPATAWTTRFISELRRSIAAALRETGNQPAAEARRRYESAALPEGNTELWLCGGGARLLELTQVCEETLNIPTHLWNPVEALKVGMTLPIAIHNRAEIAMIAPRTQQVFDEWGDTLAVTLGIALNALNPATRVSLLPKEVEATHTQANRKRQLVLTSAWGGTAIAGLIFVAVTLQQMQQHRAEMLNAHTAQITPLMNQAKTQITRELALTNLLTHRISPLDILKALSEMFKDRTQIAWTHFNISNLDEPAKAQITFNLEAASHQAINALFSTLNRSNVFTSIELGEVSAMTENRKQIFRVQVHCKLSTSAPETLAKKRHPMPERQIPEAEIEIHPPDVETLEEQNSEDTSPDAETSDENGPEEKISATDNSEDTEKQSETTPQKKESVKPELKHR